MFRPIKFLLIGFGAALAVEYPPSEALRLVDKALKNNPGLASALLSVDAAHSTGEHHSAWEAPEIGVDFYQTPIRSFPNPLKNQQEIDYSISQTIPFPGKLDAAARPHHLHGAAEMSRADAVALDLRRRILSAYADFYAAQWRARLIQEDRMEIKHLRGAARAGYEGGMGNQADLLRAESEEVRLDADALQAEEERAEAQATLSSLTGDADMLAPAGDLSPSSVELPLESLKKMAIDRRPDLKAAQFEIEMATAELNASGKEAYPDFMLSGAYKDMRDNTGGSQGFWSVGVGMKVSIAPWSVKSVRAGVDQARTLQHKSEQDYASERLRALAEVQRAAASLTSALGRLKLARDRRIPLANRVEHSTLSAYQGGKTDFNNVLAAFRETRQATEEYHRAVADHLKAWAALEWATGGALDPNIEIEGE